MQDFIVSDEESLKKLIDRQRRAARLFADFPQERTDAIFYAAAAAADRARIPLAKLAAEETGMGLAEDKAIKNHYAAEYIYNRYKKERTCGVIEEDEAGGYVRIAEPLGLIAALIPTTNPTSTVIFKALICLKTRNALLICPHPRSKKCTAEAARLLAEAAENAGAPADVVGWIDEPSVPLSSLAMMQSDTVLATGGPGMVKAAYSSGKPAIGVGAGNTPAVVDSSADMRLAVSSILHSKTFDNGLICASEQAVIVADEVYDEFRAEMTRRGGCFLSREETDKIRRLLFPPEAGESDGAKTERKKSGREKKSVAWGKLNAAAVGQSAEKIAAMAGFSVPGGTKVLLGEATSTGGDEPLSREKLSPVLGVYRTKNFGDALDKAEEMVRRDGAGHTAVLYLDERAQPERLEAFRARIPAGRILVNTPASQGGIGDLYNFRLTPSLTLGCGSRGGNSVSENVGIAQLLNVKTVASRRENMLWMRVPPRVYFKRGCLDGALAELCDVYRRKRAFLVTDRFLYDGGLAKRAIAALEKAGMEVAVFADVEPDPTLACAKAGAAEMRKFRPDAVVAFGGGSPMDAAKIMRLLYENPEVSFEELSMRFMDIRKRVYAYPAPGGKAVLAAVPTTAGTGSEVTPFAVITDEKTGQKYPLADYALLPDMAVIDADLTDGIPKGLTACAGVDALSHALEAIASVMASDFTDGIAMEAVKLLFDYLPRAYERGEKDPIAREKVMHAASMAGIAFANAFLGVCHSMAHKLGARWHMPHGMANALLLEETIRFNGADAPTKMGGFPQYAYPDCLRRYARVARTIGCTVEESENVDCALTEALIARIRALNAELRLPVTIREAIGEKGTEEEFLRSVKEMSEAAFDDQCTGANPRYPLVSEIEKMYLNAYYGRHEPV